LCPLCKLPHQANRQTSAKPACFEMLALRFFYAIVPL
jgi:hypothetical protein